MLSPNERRHVNIQALPQTPAQLGAIRNLLEACELPTADLASLSSVQFLGIEAEKDLGGVIGLELYADVALLRSLAVNPNQRGQGTGRALVAAAERQAAELGINELFLLTMSAKDFFAALGYEIAERADAPAAIKNTQQFSGICPGSAVLMRKRLA